jgi:hypothetical protein
LVGEGGLVAAAPVVAVGAAVDALVGVISAAVGVAAMVLVGIVVAVAALAVLTGMRVEVAVAGWGDAPSPPPSSAQAAMPIITRPIRAAIPARIRGRAGGPAGWWLLIGA